MTDLEKFDAILAKANAPPAPYIFGKVPTKEPPPLSIPLYDLTTEAIDAATLAERNAIIDDLKEWGFLRLPFPHIAIRFNQERVCKECGFAPLPDPFFNQVYLTMAFGGWGETWNGGIAPLDTEEMTTYYHPLTLAQFEERERDRNAGKLAPSSPVTKAEHEAALASGEAHLRTVVDCPMAAMLFMEGGSKYQSRWVNVNTDAKERGYYDPEGYATEMRAIGLEALTILLASLAARNVVKDVRYNGRTSRSEGDRPVWRNTAAGITYISRTVVRPPPASEMDGEHTAISRPHLVRGHMRNVVADTTKPQPPDVRVTTVGPGREGRRLQWIAPFYVNADPGMILPPRHYKVM